MVKFEVSISIHCEDMKGYTKYGNGVVRVVRAPGNARSLANLIERIRFLISLPF